MSVVPEQRPVAGSPSPAYTPPEANSLVGRRRFLARLSAIGAAVSAALVAIPVLRAIVPPRARRGASSWVKVADDTALLDIGVPIRVNFVQSVDDAWVETRTLNGVWLYTDDGGRSLRYKEASRNP